MGLEEEPIIFLDDDTDDHFIFSEICKKLGVRKPLKFFRSGEELLGYLRVTEDKPFIIFSDINMPQMSGLVLRRLINDDEYLRQKSIPFVFFSTAASPEQIKEAYNLTVQGFFLKEATFDELEETLGMILAYWKKCKHPNAVK
jgi:CheY-like chemotaxis protein